MLTAMAYSSQILQHLACSYYLFTPFGLFLCPSVLQETASSEAVGDHGYFPEIDKQLAFSKVAYFAYSGP